MVVGRSSDGWDDNIKLVLQKEWEGVEWIRTPQDRGEWREFVDTEINILCI
jgi:hypothetical protein